ncbi:hypothetical protein SynRS9909_01904 [Synechococcus sp. RS9909]|uniref:hypothetical protein n=1 Tax=unclassified Synechococcus TaxID=2626047 RepID=UPI000068F6B7|nr:MULTISPECIES: hypothetical protein [unclassified Synechococcus]EAQ69843.1 hypothetical protein RS9917_10416 [Synechococcus sp. RS9917]QNI79887.1 hypothetical protein SynRS9909_01904 [Synechococcus sp. RS9909]
MTGWNTTFETELSLLLKDWLKQQGRTQADLRRSLRATSTRMPALLEVLERDHRHGGLSRLAGRLCAIEAEWAANPQNRGTGVEGLDDLNPEADPFGQLDLLLQEIRDDRVS